MANKPRQEEFFAAVTKSRKAIVDKSKRRVRYQLSGRGVAKPNYALFRCWSNGDGKIRRRILEEGRFKLSPDHYVALERACLVFLENSPKETILT